MLVSKSNYDDRHFDNLGIVVRCPTLVGNRLVYFDYNTKTHGWVIRDFIFWKRLDNAKRLDKADSTLSIRDIEADVDYDEFPPWLNAECHAKEWRDYLRVRTIAMLRLHNDPFSNNEPFFTDAPNPSSGTWRDLP